MHKRFTAFRRPRQRDNLIGGSNCSGKLPFHIKLLAINIGYRRLSASDEHSIPRDLIDWHYQM
jgi:hypothetical protein